jgi:hypothetical protein
VEPNGRVGTVDPWSIRQTGLHHQYHCNGNSSRIILLHPLEHSEAQKRIEGYVKFDGQDGNSILAQHPLNVHLVIISTCIVHWFNHNESLAKELDQIVRILVIAGSFVLTISRDENYLRYS